MPASLTGKSTVKAMTYVHRSPCVCVSTCKCVCAFICACLCHNIHIQSLLMYNAQPDSSLSNAGKV